MKYPNIIVHGFFGWGTGSILNDISPYFGGYHGPVEKYLNDKGYETYTPNVGSWNSAWDRACILYAMIKGGTVDFGKVHSEKYGHARYGRTYPGLVKDWGENGKKINIIGHSFGGPTVIAFTDLVAHGSAEEREGTPADELSPLFAGGKADWIHTATTLSGTNNGTTMASFPPKPMSNFVNWVCVGILGGILGKTPFMKLWDMKMDHWDISEDPEKITGWNIQSISELKPKLAAYNKNNLDNIMGEMSVQTTAKFNSMTKTSDKIYYFARRACRTKQIGNTKFQRMELKSFPIAHISQLIVGWFNNADLRDNYGVNSEWFKSDGPVNTICTSAPFDKPSVEYVDGMEIKPGVWHNMPVEHKDHFSWMGFLEPKKDYQEYFLGMVQLADSLPDVK